MVRLSLTGEFGNIRIVLVWSNLPIGLFLMLTVRLVYLLLLKLVVATLELKKLRVLVMFVMLIMPRRMNRLSGCRFSSLPLQLIVV